MTARDGATPLLSARFREALAWAAELHAAQTRKAGDIPYLGHLLQVAGLVIENHGTEDEAIAALLHDAIEDQGGESTRREIQRRFGETVTAIVEGCTDADGYPKPPWSARKQAHVEALRHASPSVLLVYEADKLHNARSIAADLRVVGSAVWSRFSGGREGTLWYYRALLEVFQQRRPGPLVDELARVVADIERLAADAQH